MRTPHDFDGEDLKHWNKEGEIMMFHSTTQHESSNVTEEMREHLGTHFLDCRMTAAWDITPHPDLGIHTVPLYDPMDPWWEKDPDASNAEGMNDDIEAVFRAHNFPSNFEWETTPDSDSFFKRLDSCFTALGDWCGFLMGAAINQTMQVPSRRPYTDHAAHRVAFRNERSKALYMFRYDDTRHTEELVWTLQPQTIKVSPTQPGDIWHFRDGPSPEHKLMDRALMKPIALQSYTLRAAPGKEDL
jgi:hypothetical protein